MMRNDWKPMVLGLFLLAGCGSEANFSGGSSGGFSSASGSPVLARGEGRFFAVIEGTLSDVQPTASHILHLDPSRFRLPAGKVLLRLSVEHERGQSVRLLPGDASKVEVISDASGLLIRLAANDSFELRLEGRGAYRVLVSLMGDQDGDGDVDGSDGPATGENLGASTAVRPLDLDFGLDPRLEPLANLGESVKATASFLGHATPGSTVFIEPQGRVQARAASIPVTVDEHGDFTFQAPLENGENSFRAVAADSFGQRAEAGALAERVSTSSEPPASITEDKKDRIWLLDVHNNNYLFRGPLPLTSLEDTGRVDFASLIAVMNERLEDQHAPISKLPAEFDFTEISLITNQVTDSKSHGDEGNSLYLIYQSILGTAPARPSVDPSNPSSLFTRPLDNAASSGPAFDQTVGGDTYRLHPSVIWQPVAGNASKNDPTTVKDGESGYETIVRGTFPIVWIAPDLNQPVRQLSNALSNVSVATRTLHQLMAEDHRQSRPHIYYFHCVNGHDRTGMLSTTYVLSAYGPSFQYQLSKAYEYGQMGTYRRSSLPAGVEARRNVWDRLEELVPKTGKLKSKYMQAVQALAFFYYHPGDTGIQKAPKLTRLAPTVPLWEAGYEFASPPEILETPDHYLKVRP